MYDPPSAGRVWPVIMLAAAVVLWQLRPRGTPHTTIAAPVQLTSNPIETSVTGMAISPDGRYLAYADGSALWLRSIESGRDDPLDLPERLQVCPQKGSRRHLFDTRSAVPENLHQYFGMILCLKE